MAVLTKGHCSCVRSQRRAHREPDPPCERLGACGTSIGVVFGDIGTSPLYALSVAVKDTSTGGQISPDAVLGVVSLIFWSLIIVISIKYAVLIMRADNHGEGGILALLDSAMEPHGLEGYLVPSCLSGSLWRRHLELRELLWQ